MQIIVANEDFDGSNIGINGNVIRIPIDVPFEADAATLEVLASAGVNYTEYSGPAAIGQIRISEQYRGPRWFVVNGEKVAFPVGRWFLPTDALRDLIMTGSTAPYVQGYDTTLFTLSYEGQPLMYDGQPIIFGRIN